MRSALDRFLSIGPRTALAVSIAVLAVPLVFVLVTPHPLDQRVGVDYELYRDVTSRWLDGGTFFETHQLAGAYEITPGDVLYPPVAIWLFGPWALAATGGGPGPAVVAALWWAIPLGATIGAVAALRPRPWAWPLLALCASNPTTLLKIWTGNPVIWCMAAMAVGIVWRGGAPFALLKPSLFPFALFGIRQRSWWLGLAIFLVMCVPFGTMWMDWLTTVVNARGAGPLYSALEAPMLALPLVAWLGRRRG